MHYSACQSNAMICRNQILRATMHDLRHFAALLRGVNIGNVSQFENDATLLELLLNRFLRRELPSL